MIKALVVALMLAALPAPGQQPGPPIAPIALYTSFQQAPPAAVLEALHAEVESIMSTAGLRFEWRNLSSVKGNEVAVELAVLTFKGRCDIEDLGQRREHIGALGWTHVSDGVILPFSDIDCDGIRKFLRSDLFTIRPALRAAAYGRAIGRVLAHELYHIFADTKHHASCGIAKEAYSVQELLSDNFRFEDREATALRTSKAHTVLENAVVGDSSRF